MKMLMMKSNLMRLESGLLEVIVEMMNEIKV